MFNMQDLYFFLNVSFSPSGWSQNLIVYSGLVFADDGGC